MTYVNLLPFPVKWRRLRVLVMIMIFVVHAFRYLAEPSSVTQTCQVFRKSGRSFSVRFGNVEMGATWLKLAHSVSTADKISQYFPSIIIFRRFCQKEEDLLPLFHKMLEGVVI